MSTFAPTAPIASRWTRAWSGRRRWPLVSIAGGTIAAALVLLPLVFLVVQAQQSGWGEVQRLLLRHSVAVLLWNTVRLTLACTVLCAVLGVAAAWCVERTTLPARRLWAVPLVLPLGVPDFVVGFGWVSIDPALHGYLAAVMIMTLSLYPLVYLPVASALANLDAGPRGGRAQPRPGPVAGVLEGHAAPDLAGGAGRLPARDARAAGRVRGVRNRPVPDVHGGDLHRVQARLRHGGRVRAVARAGRAERRGARRGAVARRPRATPGAPGRARGGSPPGSRWGASRRRCWRDWRARRPGARGADGLARLLDAPRELDHAAVGFDPRRGRTHGRVQRRRRRARDGAGGAGERARDPPPQPRHAADRAAGLPPDGAPRPGGRARARGLLGALRVRAVPERARADRRLRDPVPAAGGGRRALGDGAGPAAPGGGGTLAGLPSGDACGGG